MNLKSWIEAFRLRTLPLALSGIFAASWLASLFNEFRISVLILSSLTALFLQILSNLANDYGDFKNGADLERKTGSRRAVQSGLISPAAMKKAVYIFAGLSFISGITLLLTSFSFNEAGTLLIFLLIGLLCIAAAIKYTMGKKPYGYAGFGDPAVFIFFGIISCAGCFYLHTQEWYPLVLLPAISIGLLATGVLNINNIRDIETDAGAGKITIPVRLGIKNAKVYHSVLIGTAVILLFLFQLKILIHPIQFLSYLILPLLIRHIITVWNHPPSATYNKLLKQLSILTLLMVLWYGLMNLLAYRYYFNNIYNSFLEGWI